MSESKSIALKESADSKSTAVAKSTPKLIKQGFNLFRKENSAIINFEVEPVISINDVIRNNMIFMFDTNGLQVGKINHIDTRNNRVKITWEKPHFRMSFCNLEDLFKVKNSNCYATPGVDDISSEPVVHRVVEEVAAA